MNNENSKNLYFSLIICIFAKKYQHYIFVIRIAGNIVNPDILGSLEYACKVSGSNFVGEAKSSNPEFVKTVSRTNVERMVNEIRKNSPILKEMEDQGEIKIVGAMYDIHNGKVEFFG